MAAENPIVGEKTRAALLAETEQAQKAFDLAPDDSVARYTYASLLYQSGDFWTAWKIAQVFTRQPDTLPEHLTLAAKVAFLLGDYASAERLYSDLVSATRNDVSANVSALVGLMFTYYEQDKFDAIKALTFPSGVDLPQHQAIAAFEGQPYEHKWHTDERTAVVPFVLTDPVPLLMIEVNGVPIAVFFDTGADTLILDPDVAAALGIEVTATAKGPFGGGLEAEFGFGQVASLALNNVTLKQVPVMILPTKRFSEVYPDRGIILGGVIGTALLRQFLATLDYAQGRLVLRERSAFSRESLLAGQEGKKVVEVPFVLEYTHLMMARGSLNGIQGLTAFVDSGLASEAKLTAPLQTLQYLNIPIPERTTTDPVGGGGGVWQSGFFEVESIELGELVQQAAQGEYGALPPEFYWSQGYIQDFLISHRFLRQYTTWTIDFDRMVYCFER